MVEVRRNGLPERAQSCDFLPTNAGRRTADIRAERPGGETLVDVSARADRVIARVRALEGDVLVFACDTDHDRHGIVTSSGGLLAPNHYLSVAIYYLFQHRPKWRKGAAVGKTVVSSQMLDRVTAKLGRKLYEVPVGFKWFVDGLLDGSLGFGGEESAGASFSRLDGSVRTTDKDGIAPALLAPLRQCPGSNAWRASDSRFKR